MTHEGPPPGGPSGDEARFHRLYAANVDRILGYALRRVDVPPDAADVVAETFLVAWRRLHQVPEGEAARLWLYGVARRTLANQRRGDHRRSALGSRLREELPTVVPDPSQAAVERQVLADAIHRLAERDREVIQLAAWEELAPREIAEVLGISPVTVRARLSRSRSRLRALLDQTPDGSGGHDPGPPGHVPASAPPTRPEEER